MPKIKEPPTEKIKSQLLANLGYYCTIKGVDREQQRLAMHISPTTFDRRKQDPGKYTVDELAKIGIAMIKSMTSTATTYEKIQWLESEKSGGREYKMSPEGESKVIYADGIPVLEVIDHAGYTGSVTLIDVIDDVEKLIYGSKETATGGIVDGSGISTPPHFAFLVAQETLNGDKKYQVDTYFNTTANLHERSGKTSEGEGFDPDFPEIPLTARDRLDKKGSHSVEYFDELPTNVPEPALKAAPTGGGS